jgi:hypothetical protein
MNRLPETIACPYCGNINPYLQDNCIKCKRPLGPIRDVMQGGSPLGNKETIEEPAKPKEPAPPIPELPPRPVEAKNGKFVDSHAFLIRGMGARAEEIAARLFKQLSVRNIQNVKLSFGKIVIELGDKKQDTREYYFAERDLGEGALAIMAVRIAPTGTDLYCEWRNFTLPPWKPIKFSWGWFIFLCVLYLIPGLIYLIVYLIIKDNETSQPPKTRKDDLEGFQFQENQAFQLSVRAALEEAIDLAGIAKSFIQEVSKDEKKDRVI